jgi:hypothetical protein
MNTILSMQEFQAEDDTELRSIGSTFSLALCGSTLSTFLC